MKIFLLAAVNPDHSQSLGLCRIVGGNETAITRATQILRRKKTKTPEIADSAGKFVVVTRAGGLCRILDDQQIVGRSDFEDGVKVGWQSKKVNWHDGSGVRSDRLFNQIRINVERDWIDVHENGSCPHEFDRVSCSDKTKWAGDNLIAGANPCGHQRKNQRVGAGSAPDSKSHAEFGSDFFLEARHIRTQNKILRFEHAGNCGHYVFTNRSELSFQIQKIKEWLYGLDRIYFGVFGG